MRCQLLNRVMTLLTVVFGGCLCVQMGCAPRAYVPPTPEPTAEPMIRVAVVQKAEEIQFGCESKFRVVDDAGQIVFSSGSGGSKWKVRLKYGQPAALLYRLVLYQEADAAGAQRRAERLVERGWQPKIMTVGKELRLGGRLLNDNRQYWVTIGPYATQEEAQSPPGMLPPDAINRVEPEISTPALGFLDLVDPSGQVVFSSGQPFTLMPVDPERGFFTIYDVTVGKGFAWERQEHRRYRGQLEFRLGNDGNVLAINELPLENYLKGTLPKEMNPGFPAAALRAQAIAARSYTIARWGIQHRLDPFDLCAEIHCQAYAGVDREHPVTDRAVEETRGKTLMYEGKVCQTFYSAVCGGHTENNENVWGGTSIPYLVGRYDLPSGKASGLPPDVSRDENVLRAWIGDVPAAFCNHLSDDAPSALHYTRKYFRWTFTYSRQEMEQILLQKLERAVGHLVDIVPLKRGISGRLMTIRIVGDEDQVVVEGELNIRRVLSPNHLPSACFVVDRQMGPDGLPGSFTFQGAGWGHGVGMCQSGAAGMALAGYEAEEILTHYYRGTEVRQLYGAVF